MVQHRATGIINSPPTQWAVVAVKANGPITIRALLALSWVFAAKGTLAESCHGVSEPETYGRTTHGKSLLVYHNFCTPDFRRDMSSVVRRDTACALRWYIVEGAT